MKRSMVIYNAINLDKFNPGNTYPDVRKELGIDPGKTLVGHIVRMTAQKDPFTMLRAMQKVAEKTDSIVLLMVGDGDLKESALELARQLKIEDHVIFQPFRSDIPAILHAIDIYCLPSLWEGFPIGVLEAMAMRKTVVATPVDGTRELVENGKTGLLVRHGNPGELADALLLLHNNPDLRKELATNGFDFVRKSFGISRFVDEVQKVYREVI